MRAALRPLGRPLRQPRQNGPAPPRCLDIHRCELLSTYNPTDEEILTRYILKFSKGGKATVAELHKDDLGLLDPSGDSGDAEGYMVQAGSGSLEL